jgi:hypothetical protein
MAETSIMNIGTNAILPFDPRKMKVLLGSAEYIALEVFVSAVVRKIMKAPKGYMELVAIHAISLPFMGGAVGFLDNNRDMRKSPTQWGELFMDGAKGVPAVLLAQWVVATFYSGFAFPWFNMKDLLITAGSKTITRPLMAMIIDYLPADLQDALDLLAGVITKQGDASTLRGKNSR